MNARRVEFRTRTHVLLAFCYLFRGAVVQDTLDDSTDQFLCDLDRLQAFHQTLDVDAMQDRGLEEKFVPGLM